MFVSLLCGNIEIISLDSDFRVDCRESLFGGLYLGKADL